MARGLRPLAASATCHVEAGVISGAGGLIRSHPKPTPGGSQGLARLIGLYPGGVARSHPRGWLEHIQDLKNQPWSRQNIHKEHLLFKIDGHAMNSIRDEYKYIYFMRDVHQHQHDPCFL